MDALTARVGEALDRHALLEPGERVLVAVSGGLDSIVLLRILHELAPRRDWRLVVAHFDHQLRGSESLADARFVRRTARSLGLECIAERGAVRAYAQETGKSLEMAARVLRHQFLARAAHQSESTCIALAHHADDQIELFMLRLFRGAGIEGLAGMRRLAPSPEDHRVRLIRPLLDEHREELARFAREHGIRFREDSSNRLLGIGRNRIRHGLLPLLRQEYQGALDQVILRTMTAMRDTADFVDQAAQAWRRARRKRDFDTLPTALQRQVISLRLRELKIPVSFELVERLRLNPNTQIPAGESTLLKRDKKGLVSHQEKVRFRAEEMQIVMEGGAGEVVFQGLRLNWRLTAVRWPIPGKSTGNARPLQRSRQEMFDADKIGDSVLLRHWRRGDRFQPIGFPRASKLQDLFVNLRIPREWRHQLVLATTRGGQIFWVEGLRIAEGFKLDKSSKRGLKWAWQRIEAPSKGSVAPCACPW